MEITGTARQRAKEDIIRGLRFAARKALQAGREDDSFRWEMLASTIARAMDNDAKREDNDEAGEGSGDSILIP